jgi:CheY-like chemotaxis protein
MASKANVLAVDDKPGNLTALQAVLSDTYNLIEASSGAEAISILEKRQDIDVILMDIQMPDMDGFQATAKIKKLDRCGDIPIIFITAVYKEDPFIKKGYEAGAIDYFGKPFDPDILKMKVGIYVSHRQKVETLKDRERRVKVSEDLMSAGRKLSFVLENLSVGILIADAQGRICQINHEVSRICKAEKCIERNAYGELLGWWDASGKLLKDPQGPMARALHEGKTSHPEPITISCLDGSKKTVLTSASPLLGFEDEIVGAAVVFQDFTDSKAIEKDLEQRIGKLISISVGL